MLPYYIMAGLIALYSLTIVQEKHRAKKRAELRRLAWELAINPPTTWKPTLGEQKTLYRSGNDPELLAEVLRATAHRYLDAALAHGFMVEVREIRVPQTRRRQIEGQIIIEVVPLPTTP